MAVSPSHLPRLAEVARVLVKHGRRDLLDDSGLAASLGDGVPDATTADASELADDLAALGPTFVKLGQLLATRADLLPDPYLEALQELQDDVEPIPFEQVRLVVEDELGARLSNAYPVFDPEPIASASLAQVHRAELRDGTPVAVKVQRPDILDTIRGDLALLDELAALVDEHTEAGRQFSFTGIIDQFRTALTRELDYRREAANLDDLAENLEGYDRLLVPGYVPDLTSTRVLTMELIDGVKTTDVPDVRLLELDGDALVDELLQAYLQQVLADGFVHADPHPGNVLLTDDDRLALIDVGMVVRVEPRMREHLLRLLVATAEAEPEEAARSAVRLGRRTEAYDEDALRRGVAEVVSSVHELPPGELSLGGLMMDIARVAGASGLRPAPELTLLGRTLMSLDQVGRALAPRFDVTDAVRRHAGAVVTEHMLEDLTPSQLLRPLLESKELLENLPERANRIIGDLADGDLTIRVDAFDEDRLMTHIEKVANRITMGLILASLVVGAALLMRVDTEATILGYPALAIVFFLAAAVGGLALIGTILFGRDRR
jgi:ubiquinone biosynthesis protein